MVGADNIYLLLSFVIGSKRYIKHRGRGNFAKRVEVDILGKTKIE